MEETTIAAVTGAILNQRNGTMGTLKNVSATAQAGFAMRIASGASVEAINGGIYTGGTDAISIGSASSGTATLGTITGAAVLYGKNGYAVNNSYESQAINIEPDLSTQLQGNARYFGTAGVSANNHITEPDKDTYPTYTPAGIKYKMSTQTEPVAGIDGVSFHYLTADISVAYNANGGQGDMSGKAYDGEYRTDLKAEQNLFTKNGFAFKNWNTRADGSGITYQVGDTIEITEANTILYAQWEARGSIEVSFKILHPNRGRGLQSPVYYSFSWFPQSDYTGGAATLKDSNENTVDSFTDESQYTFEDLPPGDYDIVLDVLDNSALVLNAGVHNGAPRSDIIVWSEDSDKLHVTIPESGTDLIRRWIFLELKAYGYKTVTDVGTFSANPAGSGIPGAPSSDGKEYVYYAVRDGGNNWNFENPESDTSSYMPYVQSHLGIYHGEKASQYSGMTALQVPTLSEEETEMGYVFKGWKLEGDDSGKIYTESEALAYTVRKHTTFIAEWERPDVTVSFDPNGGEGEMTPVTMPKGTDYTLPENGFTPPEGKVFRGWDKGGPGSSLRVMEDTVLIAQWKDESTPEPEPAPKKYTITYKLNGGKYNGSTEDIKEVYEEKTVIRIHEKPERSGYTFLYWEGSRFDPGQKYEVTKDHVFTAKWKKNGSGDSGGSSTETSPTNPVTTSAPTETPAAPLSPEAQVHEVPPAEKTAAYHTGDNMHMLFWLLLLLAGVSGMGAYLVRKSL
ncbi:MAG: InlB B-repeat-containing protein [Lachnospiraceae bacterium]|nr:InlB B-repeat-containing protein [Lachnospiraceae bacterium]